MKLIHASLTVLIAIAFGAGASAMSGRSASLAQDPVVMRLNKDEFRIAFAINGESCAPNGCGGVIHYRVNWRTTDGLSHSDQKRVAYSILPRVAQTIAVDRQYFDTAESAHTTEIVNVIVDQITCGRAEEARTL